MDIAIRDVYCRAIEVLNERFKYPVLPLVLSFVLVGAGCTAAAPRSPEPAQIKAATL